MPKGVYKVKYSLECSVCSQTFSSQKKAKYCSNICRNIVWRNNNREQHRINQSTWISSNTEQHLSNQRTYKTNRSKVDPSYKLSRTVRARLNTGLKRLSLSKNKKTLDLMGCTWEKLKLHLESEFQPGMTWDNHGIEWEIDHIIPLSHLNLTKEEELKIACHYSNLQPLFIKDHIVKSINERKQV